MNDFQTFKNLVEPLSCRRCSTYLSDRYDSIAYRSVCCGFRLCQTCVGLSRDLNYCVYCQQGYTNISFKKEQSLASNPEHAIAGAGYHISEVVKNQILIGLVPSTITVDFHIEWLPPFDEQLGVLTTDIQNFNIIPDPNTKDTNILKIVFREPYLFTKFFLQMEGKIIHHQDTNYLLCAVHDHRLYASDPYRKVLGQTFDLVCVPHGQPLEPLLLAVENLNGNPQFI